MGLPNVVYILADDMGYGDVRYLNPECKFPTPNLDRIGREGMIFTDAHSSSSVCTPSRYSILTGRYCWRTYLKGGVTHGADDALIDEGRETVASLLKKAGYKTALVGKWHLGWTWGIKDGHEDPINRAANTGDGGAMDWIDYEKPVTNGPTSRGFDYSYCIPASLDMPPYVYVENNMPVEVPTRWSDKDGLCRPGWRMESMEWNTVLPHFTEKVVELIEGYASGTPDAAETRRAPGRADADGRPGGPALPEEGQGGRRPFFLYFPLNAPHTPIAPADEFKGKSGINLYADFCMEVDHRVGQILDALDRTGQADNTLIIFTTDNGASWGPSECETLEKDFGHYCSHIYRGYKSDIWDGGHRLPFLARWPAAVQPGSSCDQRIGIFDLLATAAEITGQQIPDNAGEDCESFLPALKGQAIDESRREGLVHHSIGGMFALRRGKWKLCRCPGSGGWGKGDLTDQAAREEGLPEIQLYDMVADPGEKENLVEKHPEIVKELTELLHRYVATGRSTPGPEQQNAPEVPLENWRQLNWLPEIPQEFVVSD
ncbi:arylsulfatase [Verrucomicrobiota bacterium]